MGIIGLTYNSVTAYAVAYYKPFTRDASHTSTIVIVTNKSLVSYYVCLWLCFCSYGLEFIYTNVFIDASSRSIIHDITLSTR